MALLTRKIALLAGLGTGSIWLASGARSPEEQLRSLYRESRRVQAAEVQALKMDWGTPLPFKSEILTKWGSRGEVYRAQKFGSSGQPEKGVRHVSR